MTTDFIWQTKVAARLHDPAEKALVLLRDPAGHENGTSLAMARLLGFHELNNDAIDADNDEALVKTLFKKGIPAAMYRHVQHADWWAAAADRPQWPYEEITVTTKKEQEKTLRVAPWAQVRWTNEPMLIHPLTGDVLNLKERGDLSDSDFHEIKEKSFDHLSELLLALHKQNPDAVDWKKTLLTLWRFAADTKETQDNSTIGELWHALPADTRVPDHSIWDHLDLTSAFAGGFAADANQNVALLSLSIGPVQPFIASARKMDDLWAGSHLLAQLSWQAMKVVCEELGPDAILFPRLRGIPQVDLWLRDECGLPQELFKNCDWQKGTTDANPLFAAALPNRFVAVVPEDKAKTIAEKVQQSVRQWIQELGEEVVVELLTLAGYTGEQETMITPYEQMKSQLQNFPEVHWAAVPFSLIKVGDKAKQRDLDISALSESMQPFFTDKEQLGFLATPAWQLLQQDIALKDAEGKSSVFWSPNPGVLYPAIHDLAERVMAAAKANRPFNQSKQEGWRCTLTGETEWLTTDKEQLFWNQHYREKQGTLWTKIAEEKPAWAKKGEHLGGLAAIKRLWPTLFARRMDKALGKTTEISRFVVSTHTMALAEQLDQWLEHGGLLKEGLAAKIDSNKQERVALPRKLVVRHKDNQKSLKDAAILPALLDLIDGDESQRFEIEQKIKDSLGVKNIEAYYSLILMDGDRMGAWLAGGDDYAISYLESFHPQVKTGFEEHAKNQPLIKSYGEQKRALSPNRHLAISGALNDFSQTVVRHVVEEEYMGRLIYSGGDDVFAMASVKDALPMVERLRHAYSGHDPDHEGGVHKGLTLQKGFALLNGKLMRMMGTKATASCGVVIAHHQAPLSAVRRELEKAESRAKNEGGRDAFSITIIKRSGGALYLTEKWGQPIKTLQNMIEFLAQDGVSRRAIYHTLQWLNSHEIPELNNNEVIQMLVALLVYQLDRQVDSQAKEVKASVPAIVAQIEQLLQNWDAKESIKKLRNFLSVAEFLARETRTGGQQ